MITKKESQERKERIAQLTAEGYTLREVAEKLGMGFNALRKFCVYNGIRSQKTTIKQRFCSCQNEILDKIKHGWKLKVLAREYHINYSTFRTLCQETGVYEEYLESRRTQRRIELIEELTERGFDKLQIAAELGMTARTFGTFLCENNINPNRYANEYLTDYKDEIRDKLINGATIQQLASEYAVPSGLFYGWRKRNGLTKQDISKLQAEKFAKLYELGQKRKQVAKDYGLTPDTVCKILQRHKLFKPMRARGRITDLKSGRAFRLDWGKTNDIIYRSGDKRFNQWLKG